MIPTRSIYSNKGYVALSTILVLAMVILTISLSSALITVSGGQTALSGKKSEEALQLIEGCVAEALLTLNETGTIPLSIPLPQISCTVTIEGTGPPLWTFTVTGTFEGYTQSARVSAQRDSRVTVTGWELVD
ncbi:hypothetical protein HY468_04050 [Candidatus Roizmanbacteria bacterium]|nr:hypothetical protein [Candidatus Roizmanbacteria bacterium]